MKATYQMKRVLRGACLIFSVITAGEPATSTQTLRKILPVLLTCINVPNHM